VLDWRQARRHLKQYGGLACQTALLKRLGLSYWSLDNLNILLCSFSAERSEECSMLHTNAW